MNCVCLLKHLSQVQMTYLPLYLTSVDSELQHKTLNNLIKVNLCIVWYPGVCCVFQPANGCSARRSLVEKDFLMLKQIWLSLGRCSFISSNQYHRVFQLSQDQVRFKLSSQYLWISLERKQKPSIITEPFPDQLSSNY